MTNRLFRYLKAVWITLDWFWRPAPSEHSEYHPIGIILVWGIAKTMCDLEKETK